MYRGIICGMTPEKWNAMSEKEREDFKDSVNDLANFAFKDVYKKRRTKKDQFRRFTSRTDQSKSFNSNSSRSL